MKVVVFGMGGTANTTWRKSSVMSEVHAEEMQTYLVRQGYPAHIREPEAELPVGADPNWDYAKLRWKTE
jgi:hypothetical protein